MEIILTTIVSNAVSICIVGFLLKLWIDKRLSYSLDLELEKFKSQLAKEVGRDSIQQKWVNDKRMELFEQLYELMIEMDFELKALFMNIKVQNQEFTKNRAEAFCEKYTSLNAVLHKNEIFLNSEVVDEIREVYRPYFELGMDCLGNHSVANQLKKKLPDTMEEITAIADSPRKKIVQAFRHVAGIDS